MVLASAPNHCTAARPPYPAASRISSNVSSNPTYSTATRSYPKVCAAPLTVPFMRASPSPPNPPYVSYTIMSVASPPRASNRSTADSRRSVTHAELKPTGITTVLPLSYMASASMTPWLVWLGVILYRLSPGMALSSVTEQQLSRSMPRSEANSETPDPNRSMEGPATTFTSSASKYSRPGITAPGSVRLSTYTGTSRHAAPLSARCPLKSATASLDAAIISMPYPDAPPLAGAITPMRTFPCSGVPAARTASPAVSSPHADPAEAASNTASSSGTAFTAWRGTHALKCVDGRAAGIGWRPATSRNTINDRRTDSALWT